MCRRACCWRHWNCSPAARWSLLAYNEQTTGPVAQTEQILEAANENDIAVVLADRDRAPDGDTYVSWMSGNLDAIATAPGS